MTWQLPERNREAPPDRVFFGGPIYGSVGNDASVILDGETATPIGTPTTRTRTRPLRARRS